MDLVTLAIAATPSFIASAVEFVEATTIVLAVGLTRGWRAPLVGTALATATLAVIVATLGVALVTVVPEKFLLGLVGTLLLLFGLRWLRKAVLRFAGIVALHDEDEIYRREVAELRAQGLKKTEWDWVGTIVAYKAVELRRLLVRRGYWRGVAGRRRIDPDHPRYVPRRELARGAHAPRAPSRGRASGGAECLACCAASGTTPTDCWWTTVSSRSARSPRSRSPGSSPRPAARRCARTSAGSFSSWSSSWWSPICIALAAARGAGSHNRPHPARRPRLDRRPGAAGGGGRRCRRRAHRQARLHPGSPRAAPAGHAGHRPARPSAPARVHRRAHAFRQRRRVAVPPGTLRGEGRTRGHRAGRGRRASDPRGDVDRRRGHRRRRGVGGRCERPGASRADGHRPPCAGRRQSPPSRPAAPCRRRLRRQLTRARAGAYHRSARSARRQARAGRTRRADRRPARPRGRAHGRAHATTQPGDDARRRARGAL